MTSSDENLPYNKKLALIIGNGDYNNPANKLPNAVKNAMELSDVLRQIGFIVTSENNIKKEDEMLEVVKKFVENVKSRDLILFYFSGHGCQIADENYLIPTDDSRIGDDDVEYLANFDNIRRRLVAKAPRHKTILILDCCRPYVRSNGSPRNPLINDHGLREIRGDAATDIFIQFSCTANQTTSDDLFIKQLLKNIAQKNRDVRDVFRHIEDSVYQERNRNQRPFSFDGLVGPGPIYLNAVNDFLPNIPYGAKWKQHGETVAGGRGPGHTPNRLHRPEGLCLHKKQNILVTDTSNHRIMEFKQNSKRGRRVAGQNLQGYRTHLLAAPSNAIYNGKKNNFIICDYHNRRVLRWVRGSMTYAEVIIGNGECYGVALDDRGALYVSDTEHHEVRRYEKGDLYGTVVAGGNGQGRRLKQLNHPTYICIGDNQSVYVSDSWNDRVVRWDKDAKQGVIVAGGNRKGKDRTELDCPAGIVVDQRGTVYVADRWNHRVMSWCKGQKRGDVLIGDYLPGSDTNQLICPEGLAFDRRGNLYVADWNNHRIQRFNINKI